MKGMGDTKDEVKKEEKSRKELTKEQKASLANFRDQVRYKDYKGLIKTLKNLEDAIKNGQEYVIDEKYKKRYEMIHENILLLKNILISDIKYSITNEKGLEKSAVLLSTILSENYRLDIQRSIITWLSNTVQTEHIKEIQKIEKISEIQKTLEYLLGVKDSIGIKTAHLPIWWNISKVILCDLSVILKNKLIRIIDRAEFSSMEYLNGLKEAMEFETTYLAFSRAHKPKEKDSSFLQLTESSPSHLWVLDDISTVQPICSEILETNSLTVAFIPYIELYIENEVKAIESTLIVFSGEEVPASVYSIYRTLTEVLGKLTYFNFPSVGHSFLKIVDKSVAKIIRKTTFLDAGKNFLSGIETISYIDSITKEMIDSLEKRFKIVGYRSAETDSSVSDLRYRICASYMLALKNKLYFLNSKTLKHRNIDKYKEKFLAELIEEVDKISKASITDKMYLIKEWLDMVGESIFLILISVKFEIFYAEDLLYFMSAIEIPLKHNILAKLSIDINYSVFDKAKIFLKLFLQDPSAYEIFIDSFYTISNGLFHFHQVLSKVPKKHHKNLINIFNKRSSELLPK